MVASPYFLFDASAGTSIDAALENSPDIRDFVQFRTA